MAIRKQPNLGRQLLHSTRMLTRTQALAPLYSAWLAYTTFTGARSGLMGGGMPADGGAAQPAGQSKRQQKMEKRGGQRVQYR